MPTLPFTTTLADGTQTLLWRARLPAHRLRHRLRHCLRHRLHQRLRHRLRQRLHHRLL